MAQLSISDVRREIVRSSGNMRTPGVASTTLIGGRFHDVLAGIMGPRGWRLALEPGELTDANRLACHTYEKLLGPRLAASQASLREYGAETLDLWEAVQSMCGWVCRLLASASERNLIRYNSGTRTWEGAGSLCRTESPLEWEVREPPWTAPVVVSGVPDALLLDPASGRWCVVEYKIGQGHTEADLGQACLYHAMLRASNLSANGGALAVFSFRPTLEERFYAGADLESAQSALRALIGRLAGVLPPQRPVTVPRPPEPPPSGTAHTDLGKQLVRALAAYGAEVQWNNEVIVGPAFLRFPVIPARNVKKNSITSRAAELQMQLRLEQEPFIDVVKGRLVIDVQRPDRQTVTFSEVCDQIPKNDTGSSLVPLGVDLDAKLQFADLASPGNPHLLVAGTSGSGKSEWLRLAIAGLIFSNSPDTMRFVLIDPKRTAFTELKTSPYLFGAKGLVYPPEDPVIDSLESLIEEMEDRYKKFSNTAVSDLTEYSAKTGEVLPRIVCVCDEYADLIHDRTTRKEVETAINRLGAKARAAGIHLIIATQHPDRNTVGGALKANLAGRVCLRTTNHTQSNMIINQSGAERLLGRGDLFFLSIGAPARLQAPFVTAQERARLFEHKA